MPDNRRAPRKLLVFTLALPIFALVYVTTFGSRLWAALRPSVAAFLGATVITSVYAEEALKRAPATPMRAAATLALAIALVAPAVSPAPAAAAPNPAESVIAAARSYVGSRYKLGAEGPRTFDCSGLIFRVFADAGELPRVGGLRMRAAGYMRWFVSRGLFTKKEANARRGDLVVWNNGAHIGIYLGDGKALSALVNPWGISVHRIDSIKMKLTHFLQVNWSRGDGSGDSDGPGKPEDPKPKPPKPDAPRPDRPEQPDNQGPSAAADNDARPERFNAVATGTMNLRQDADPTARIIGWVGRNASFRIVDRGNSPAGYLWFEVELRNGKQGWVYSRWVREP